MPAGPPLPRQNSVDSTTSSPHQSPKRATPSETRDGNYFSGIPRRDSLSQQPPQQQSPPSRPPVMKPPGQPAQPAKPAGSSAAAQDKSKANEPKKKSEPGLFG